MQGTGSQQIEKQERAPLFKPEDSIQWTHGAPNHSDFYQSRAHKSMSMNNVKPWESVQVGPGMNHSVWSRKTERKEAAVLIQEWKHEMPGNLKLLTI